MENTIKTIQNSMYGQLLLDQYLISYEGLQKNLKANIISCNIPFLHELEKDCSEKFIDILKYFRCFNPLNDDNINCFQCGNSYCLKQGIRNIIKQRILDKSNKV